jgi:hypothetical protein
VKKISIIRPRNIEVGSKDLESQSYTFDPSRKNRLEDILSFFIDENGICKKCGHDHSYHPKYEDLRSSIDIIPDLIRSGSF